MTREEKIALARRLRAEGKTYEAIGKQLGVAHATAWKWLHPARTRELNRRINGKRTEAKRQWALENRQPCSQCGQTMGIGSAVPSSRPKLCVTCSRDERAQSRLSRAIQIEGWWREGRSMAHIAGRLGWTPGSLSRELDWMRAAGFEVPYRHHYKEPVHQAQVVA